jgi:hypothetical protein
MLCFEKSLRKVNLEKLYDAWPTVDWIYKPKMNLQDRLRKFSAMLNQLWKGEPRLVDLVDILDLDINEVSFANMEPEEKQCLVALLHYYESFRRMKHDDMTLNLQYGFLGSWFKRHKDEKKPEKMPCDECGGTSFTTPRAMLKARGVTKMTEQDLLKELEVKRRKNRR